MTSYVILYCIKTFSPHNVSNRRNFHQKQFINEYAITKKRDKKRDKKG